MFEPLDFDRFHRESLPALLAANGAAGAVGLAPLAFRLPDGRAWTYAVGAAGVGVTPGDDGAETVAALTESDWSDFVLELRTCYGLLYAGRVSFPRGTFDALDRWEPVLRGVFHGRPPYDRHALDGVDLGRTFGADELGPAGEFLRTAGFVHVRGVFSADEIASVGAEVDRLRQAARQTDGRSWWAKDRAGEDLCCRLIYATELSELLHRFVQDVRFSQLAALGGEEVLPILDRLDGVGVVLKCPSAVEGLANLPWHRDCGLGGHPVLCPSLAIGVQLDAANAASGQLRFLAGSHRTTGAPPPDGDTTWPVVGIDAAPGDVTVHFTHVLHVAPPPESPDDPRRTMYVTFSNPLALEMVPAGGGYNDVLFTTIADGHVPSPDGLLTTG